MRTIRIINDIILYFCFCFLAGTGLMMEFSFVKGAGPQYVLSMGKKAWETGHFWVGVVAILAFILHFCLNSRFFKNVLKTRIVYVLFVIIGFGGAILLAVWPTEKGETAIKIYDLADGQTYTPTVDNDNYIGYPIQLLPDDRVVVTNGWYETTAATDRQPALVTIDMTAYLNGSTDYTPIEMYTGK